MLRLFFVRATSRAGKPKGLAHPATAAVSEAKAERCAFFLIMRIKVVNEHDRMCNSKCKNIKFRR